MIAIVIPTIRSLDFLEAWREQWSGYDYRLIVVEDHEKQEITLPKGFQASIYTHKDIKKDLGENSWIIPRRSAGIASYGFYKAWQLKPDWIYTIDDDCMPLDDDLLGTHASILNMKVNLGWISSSNEPTRGYPYNVRQNADVVVSHGMWAGLPDYDGMTHLVRPNTKYLPYKGIKVVPKGSYFPMCRMNLAFKPEMAIAMYSLLQGEGWPVNRFEDIWAGVISKKITDHLGLAITSGVPNITHAKEYSYEGMVRTAHTEMNGIYENDRFWPQIDNIILESTTINECFVEIANKLQMPDTKYPDYWTKNIEAMKLWAQLYD